MQKLVLHVLLNVFILRTVLRTGRSRCVSVKNGAELRIHRGNTVSRFQNLPTLRPADEEARRTQRIMPYSLKVTQNGTDSQAGVVSKAALHLKELETDPLKPSRPGSSPSTPEYTIGSPLPTIKTFFNHVMVVSMVPNKRKKNEILQQLSGSSRTRFSLRTELRVARTTAVVVGAFVICWFPFTSIYVLQAYNLCSMASGCVPGWLFVLAFWLGYANSAVNPLLYAAFSRDFRAAFRRVLLRKQGSMKSF